MTLPLTQLGSTSIRVTRAGLGDAQLRVARVGDMGREWPIASLGEEWFDISSVTTEVSGDFFETGGMARVRAALVTGGLPRIDVVEGLRFGAPVGRPSVVICIGMNYAAHAAESGSVPPDSPIMFFKPPNTVVGPDDAVAIPSNSHKTDWEVELGVVIGKRTSYLSSPAASMDFVAGFVAANDISEREFQLEISGGQWSKGKSAAGFTPVGPWLVDAADLDYRALALKSWVNGEPRQNSATTDMIFDVPYLIWYLSQYLVLEPGDLVLTGTPAGVGLSGRYPYLVAGDVCELEIEGLGHQRQVFIVTPPNPRRSSCLISPIWASSSREALRVSEPR